MKKFLKPEIDKWKTEFINRNYPRRASLLDDRIVEYFILPDNLFQGIPNGLFRMTGDFKEGYLVGVSDKVPEKIRPYFALSEHDEFMVYGLSDSDRTLHSEENIIKIIGNIPPLKKLYIENKSELYDYFLKHSIGNLEQWGFEQADYDGFIRANNFLKSIK